MVIDFDSAKKRIGKVPENEIDTLLQSAIDESRSIENNIEYLSASLAGLVTLRKILRHAKRRGDLDEAIRCYAFDCCPPSEENELCGEIPCTECWSCFCKQFSSNALQ